MILSGAIWPTDPGKIQYTPSGPDIARGNYTTHRRDHSNPLHFDLVGWGVSSFGAVTYYQYAKEKLKRIPLDVPKTTYEEIKTHAEAHSESANGFIKRAISGRPWSATTALLGPRLFDYRGRGEYRYVIGRARLRVENYAETRLFDRDGYSGVAFILKIAFNWGCPGAAFVVCPARARKLSRKSQDLTAGPSMSACFSALLSENRLFP